MNAIKMSENSNIIETMNKPQKTREQILSQEVLTNQDIQILFGIKHTKACEVMKAIRSVSDIIHISTIVHIKDYIAYTSRFDNKNNPTE